VEEEAGGQPTSRSNVLLPAPGGPSTSTGRPWHRATAKERKETTVDGVWHSGAQEQGAREGKG
jgi:hypothetical protein